MAAVRKLKHASEAREGQRVLYQGFPGGVSEIGHVTSVNESFVFVRFGSLHSMACRPQDLIVECEPGDARREVRP